eukprot:6211801-Pleurochrysis_carterae.AAC.3
MRASENVTAQRRSTGSVQLQLAQLTKASICKKATRGSQAPKQIPVRGTSEPISQQSSCRTHCALGACGYVTDSTSCAAYARQHAVRACARAPAPGAASRASATWRRARSSSRAAAAPYTHA